MSAGIENVKNYTVAFVFGRSWIWNGLVFGSLI